MCRQHVKGIQHAVVLGGTRATSDYNIMWLDGWSLGACSLGVT